MKKNASMLAVVLVLLVVLILLIVLAVQLPLFGGPSAGSDTTPSQTEPSQSQPTETDPTGSQPTEPAPTESEPTEPEPTEPEPTQPTEPGEDMDEMIGTLYTRGELMALPNDKTPYGPGTAKDGNRPPYADPTQNRLQQYGTNFIAPDNGKVYLTFDCGYEYTATDADGTKYRVTERILDVLKEKNVKAVFFVTMPYVKSQPDLVQRMIDEGHAVGNHSNNHPVMPDISVDEMVYEVMSLHEYVEEKFGYTMDLFRFPTGAYSVRSLAVVQSLGYESVHWSFAYADYTPSNQPTLENALNTIKNRHHSGAIYLLHAVSTSNAAVLGDAIDFFVAQGYTLDLFTK